MVRVHPRKNDWTVRLNFIKTCGKKIELEAVVEVGFRVELRINGVVGFGHGIAPLNRGTTESDRERGLTDIQSD